MGRDEVIKYIEDLIQNETLEIKYQPQFCYNGERFSIIGVEVLARPDKSICHIDRFVKVAVETNLISDLSYWILSQSLRQLRQWLDDGVVSTSFNMSVNITGQQLKDKNFTSKILEIIEQEEILTSQVTLEITETSLIDDVNIAKIFQLSRSGVNISIDDFGTGYSSLGRLKLLPINEIKIDKIFIDDITKTSQDVALVTAMYQLTKALDKYTVVEGVENRQQFQILKNIGFNCFQGYFFERPSTAEDTTEIIKLANSLHSQ